MKRYVYYVQVGNMPKHLAEKHLKKVEKRIKKVLDTVIIVPIRTDDGVTRIERLK